MLRLAQPLFKPLVFSQPLNHIIEVLHEIADLIFPVHRELLIQISRRDPFRRCDDMMDGFRVPEGEQNGYEDTEGEDQQGGNDALDGVAPLECREVFRVHLEMDIAVIGLARDDRYHDIVRLAFL